MLADGLSSINEKCLNVLVKMLANTENLTNKPTIGCLSTIY